MASSRRFASPSLRSVALLALALGAFVGPAPLLAAEPLRIMVDQARVMRIDRPADTVIIGNPAIADATIRDNRTLIITGRTFGTTNLIVLDAEGKPITDELLSVESRNDGVVTVYKLSRRETYSCTPVCEPVLRVGDDADVFDERKTQIEDRNTLAQGAAQPN